jgi:hypothetical protein
VIVSLELTINLDLVLAVVGSNQSLRSQGDKMRGLMMEEGCGSSAPRTHEYRPEATSPPADNRDLMVRESARESRDAAEPL